MNLITWNIQWARGADGVVDPRRIVRVCREMADFDVLCFQEVARNFPGLAGNGGADVFAQLAAELPGFAPYEGLAVDALGPGGARQQFGVLILTRRPVIQVFRHLLPWPADPTVPSMQRVALEVVVAGARARLRELHAEAAPHAADQPVAAKEGGPFEARARPRSAILTADFNFPPADPLYARLQQPIAGAPAYRDAWRIRHPDRPHAPTFGLYDKEQWSGEPFACDFIFVTEDLADRVTDVVVNWATKASDHQPVLLQLAE